MNLIIFILALSVLIMVHEFGHYFMAIKTGVKVEEFGLGLPPRIIGKKIGKTIFSLNWLPIGGFCRLYGEDGEGKGTDAFNNKKAWQKALVVLGGVAMNVILAVVIFAVVYTVNGIPTTTDKVKIEQVVKGSPAETAGLKEGDWVYRVGGQLVKTPDELTVEIAKYKGNTVDLTLKTENEEKIINVAVRENPPAGEGSVGIAISNSVVEKIKWYQFYKGIGVGFEDALTYGKAILLGLGKMVGDLFRGQIPKDVSGPIGMYQMTSTIKDTQGMLVLLYFFGIISVNLAVMNVLPLPALDGGRIVFVLYEMITKKKANQKFEAIVNGAGMVFLLTLMAVITVSDIWKLIVR